MARWNAVARMGYYPLPEKALEALIKLFSAATFTNGRIIDPCAGEGVALEALSKAWNLKPFANEYDITRAKVCAAKFGATNAVQGDAFTLNATGGSFNIVYLNPPFQSNGIGGNRTEADFLTHAWKWVARGGYLVFVSYVHHLSADVLNDMWMNSENVDIYRVPGFDLGEYFMTVTVCKVKDRPNMRGKDQAAAMAQLEQAQKSYELALNIRERGYEPTEEDMASMFEDITTVTEPRYTLTEVKTRRGAKFEFAPRNWSRDALIEIAKSNGPQNLFAFQSLMTPKPVDKTVRVVIMPRFRQLVNLLAAGLFNGFVIETENGRAVVRSVVRQVERLVQTAGDNADRDDEYDDGEEGDEDTSDTSVTKYRTAPETTITLLYEDGHVENISEDAKLVEFIKNHKDQLMRHVEETFVSDYKFDFVDGQLKPVIDSLKLNKGTKSFSLLTTQKHVTAALFSRLRDKRSAILCGEMGTGKTVMLSSIMELMRPREADDPFANVYEMVNKQSRMRDDQFNIVICPPHLVEKWERELRSISPDAYIGTVRSGEGSKPIVEVMNFIRGIPAQKPNTLKVIILSREMMKSGEGWIPAYQERITRDHKLEELEKRYFCPTTGKQIVEPKKGNAPPKVIPVARLSKSRHYFGLMGRSKEFRTPKRGAKLTKFRAGESMREDLARAYRIREEYAETKPQYGNERVAHELNRIRIARIKSDAQRREHPALWQEARTFSALPQDPGVVLAERLGVASRRGDENEIRRVMPLPDLAQTHLAAHPVLPAIPYINHKSPRGPVEGVAKFLAKYYGKQIYMLVADECHEYASPHSAQGVAMMALAEQAAKVIYATGTLYKGVASSLYTLEFSINPRVRFMYPWMIEGDRIGEKLWASTMGVMERVVKIKSDRDGRSSGKMQKNEQIKEVPGASPELLREIIDHTIFVGLKDIGKVLPPFVEEGVPVQMDKEMAIEYRTAQRILKDYLMACKNMGDSSFLGAYFNALLNWPNFPFADYEVWHNKRVIDPKTEEERIFPTLVHTIKGLGYDYVTAKERELVSEVRAALSEGRGVAIYFRQTGASKRNPEKDILKRTADLLKREIQGAKPTILTTRVKTGDREAWLAKQKDANILLCNANLVKTGLDLLQFPTIIWAELDFSLTTMQQASHRAWRIGQDKDCVVKYLFYVMNGGKADDVEVKYTEDGDIDITGLSVEQAQLTAVKAMGLKTSDLAAHAVADAVAFFMGGSDEEEQSPEPSPSGGMKADTMEAQGIVLMTEKRNAAAFLYGEEGASLSAMTQGGGGNLKDMLAEAIDKDMVVDSAALFRRAVSDDSESDWTAPEDGQQPEIVAVEAPIAVEEPAIQETPLEIVHELVGERITVFRMSHIGTRRRGYEKWQATGETGIEGDPNVIFSVFPEDKKLLAEAGHDVETIFIKSPDIAVCFDVILKWEDRNGYRIAEVLKPEGIPQPAQEEQVIAEEVAVVAEEAPAPQPTAPAIPQKVLPESERISYWQKDAGKYGKPFINTDQGIVIFTVDANRSVVWTKLENGEYLRQCIQDKQVVYNLTFAAKAQKAA